MFNKYHKLINKKKSQKTAKHLTHKKPTRTH